VAKFLRTPIVAFAYVVDRLRRVPVAAQLLAHTTAVAAGLIATAVLAFVLWGSEVVPQRVSLADLVEAKLSHMQTWIIISGDLRTAVSNGPTYRYNLTDPAAPNARMNVFSTVELPEGQTTVSGNYVGGIEQGRLGFPWVGTMRADPVLAREQPPPWIALILGATGLVVGVSSRFSYPMFFDETPRGAAPRRATLPVGVRRQAASWTDQAIPATLRLDPGAPVELHVSDADEQPLRIYSAFTSAGPGELRGLSRTEAVMRVRQPTGDLDIIFASRDDRDAAFAALAAERRVALGSV